MYKKVPWLAAVGALLITGGVVFARRAARDSAPVPLAQGQFANRLAGAASPYLRSAAEQPVAWQQWGPDAFRLARTLDRPIWLDIGAIWCHWCHVMDRESYGNPQIAELINANFVPVKVDRDERPDIDTRYQLAHQVINGTGGGWPLTMFLMPAGEPFAGGTYFPPETGDGMPGIRQLVQTIAGAYRQQHDRVLSIGRQVRKTLAKFRSNTGATGTLTPELPLGIAYSFAAEFDSLHGGFGRQPGPKFPEDIGIRLAVAEGFLMRDPALRGVGLRTLDAYARSGIRDYVHGGFFRYSTNRDLTVPHFEKMDYVQSGLLRAYLDAYRLTGDSQYAAVARDIMGYVTSTLSDRRRGGFYAHQDADTSLNDDGAYYTWSLAQLRAAVPAPEAAALRLYYDIGERGEVESHPAQNVLRIARSAGEVAKELGTSPAQVRRQIRDGTARLLAARTRYQAPLVEETKFTDRNGMMVTAYLDAYESLGDTATRDFALRTLDFLLDHAVGRDGSVTHATAGERSYVEGMMGDYAELTAALLDGFQVSGNARYLRAAEGIMNRAVERFWDKGGAGFYDLPSQSGAPGLLAERAKEFTDTPLPGDNAVAAQALLKLYLLTSDDRWRQFADRTLAAFAASAAGRGSVAASYALAAEALLRKPPQVVIIGPRADPRTHALATAAWRTYRPGRLVATYDPTTVALDSLPEAVAGAARVFKGDPTPRAYVCVGETCAPPTTSPAAVATLVRDYGRAGAGAH
jgi:uncharacterized protein